jgi:hypothetical protein
MHHHRLRSIRPALIPRQRARQDGDGFLCALFCMAKEVEGEQLKFLHGYAISTRPKHERKHEYDDGRFLPKGRAISPLDEFHIALRSDSRCSQDIH